MIALLGLLACGSPGTITTASTPAGTDLMALVHELDHQLTWHAAGPTGSEAWQARNTRGRLRAWFDAYGTTMQPRTKGAWSVRLQSVAVDCGTHTVVLDPVTPTAEGRRITWARGGVDEWYINGDEGLEHGFTLRELPSACHSSATVTLKTDAPVAVAPDGVHLVVGSQRISYSGLHAFDARGLAIPARVSATPSGIALTVTTDGAMWPITIDPLLSILQTTFDGAEGVDLGHAVSIDGATAAVSTHGGDDLFDRGAVYIFERTLVGPDRWTLSQILDGPLGRYGTAVALSGDTLVVGAPTYTEASLDDAGWVGVYERHAAGAGTWGLTTSYVGDSGGVELGSHVAASGQAIAYSEGKSDGVFVAETGPLGWTARREVEARATSLALDAVHLAVGSEEAVTLHRYREDGPRPTSPDAIFKAGFAADVAVQGETLAWTDRAGLHIYDHDGGDWSLSGSFVHDGSLDLDARQVAVIGTDGAHILRKTGLTWTDEETLTDIVRGDIGISGVLLIAGDRIAGAGGQVTFYERTLDRFDPMGVDGLDDDPDGSQAVAVALSGDRLAIGAPGDDGEGVAAGAVHLMRQVDAGWEYVDTLRPPDLGAGDQFGKAVALADRWLAVGIPGWDGTAFDGGAVRVYEESDALDWDEVYVVDGGTIPPPGYEPPGLRRELGSSLALDPPLLAIGAPHSDGAGLMQLVVMPGADTPGWTVLPSVGSEAPEGSGFGTSVAVSGDRIWVGAPYTASGGQVHTYRYADAALRVTDILSYESGSSEDEFGASVALSGPVGLIGAPGVSSIDSTQEGAGFVYRDGGDGWVREALVRAPSPQSEQRFGVSTATDGERLWVGAPGVVGASLAGTVHLFEYTAGLETGTAPWGPVTSFASPVPRHGDRFGRAVDTDALRVAIGAPGSGSAYLYRADLQIRPVAIPDHCHATEDETTRCDVLANDSDANGDRLTIDLDRSPENGVFVAVDDAVFYTPDPDFFGTDSFGYRVSDGVDTSETVEVVVDVTPVADAPLTTDDAVVVHEDSIYTSDFSVLDNDTDADSDTLFASVTVEPVHGDLEFFVDGTFIYTPSADFHGLDFFEYEAADLIFAVSARVEIEVRPVNDPPVGFGDVYILPEDAFLIVPTRSGVLANDIDIDGDALTAVVIESPSHGALTLAPGGGFEFEPFRGYAGPDAFTYTVSDGILDDGPVAVELIISEAPPGLPIARPDRYAGSVNTTLSITDPRDGLLDNDSDPEAQDLTASVVTPPESGTLDLSEDGTFSFTPAVGMTGSTSFTYRITTSDKRSAEAIVTLTMFDEDERPIAVDDAYDVEAGTLLTVGAGKGLLTNDRDPDGAGLIASVVSPPQAGLLSLARDGSFQFDAPPDAGELTFTYVVSDGGATSPPASVTLSILTSASPTDTGTAPPVDTGDTGHVCTPSTWYADQDGDGYGDPRVTSLACDTPKDFVADRTDCNDQDTTIHPGASEVPEDGIDQDCDNFDIELEAVGSCSTGLTQSTWTWLGLVGALAIGRRRRPSGVGCH